MVVIQATLTLFCLFIVAFSTTLAVGNPIKYQYCEGMKFQGEVSSVDISPCPSQPCVLHKGTKVTATIKFTPFVTVTNGTLEVDGIIGGKFKVKFPLPNPDACKGHNLVCPLKAGKAYTLIGTLYVNKIYPNTPLDAQMIFKLPEDKYLYCVHFRARIAN